MKHGRASRTTLPIVFHAIAGLTLALAAGGACAATITVTTTADNTNAGDGECTLREAIINAQSPGDPSMGDCAEASSNDNSIQFTGSLTGQTITLNGNALPSIARSLTIEGPIPGNPSAITIDADGESRIIDVETSSPPADVVLNLKHLTLTNGRVNGDHEFGGAIRALSELRMTNVRVIDSSTGGLTGLGGGIYSEVMLNLIQSEVTGNWTSGEGAHGGGIAFSGRAELVDSLLNENETRGTDATAGGITYLLADDELTMTRTRIIENHVADGGVSGVQTSSIHAEDSIISRNTGGIGLFSFIGNIVDTTVSDNQGTGVLFYIEGVIDSSTIAGNQGGNGGVHTTVSSSIGGLHFVGELEIRNSTITGNHSLEGGGGVNVGWYPPGRGQTGGRLRMVNSTVFGNRSDTGPSDIYGYGEELEFDVDNSIIAATNGAACNVLVDGGTHNLFTDTSCGGTATPLATIGLGALADNDGPMLTHAPRPGSAAIDAAGDCVGEFGVDTDQRGQPRPQGPACDIGSVEALGVAASAIPATGRTAILILASALLWLAWRGRFSHV